ncbi:DNA primase [Thermus scotoductus]|uniref:DNA primase n=1 Tax=Thermus scotoductus TaxID=37636 RepID=UPI0020A453E2|nr:DNA primase [Thermus scotoductus]
MWRAEEREGGPTKVPYSPKGSPKPYRASVRRPEDWGTYEEALAALRRYPGRYSGLGVVLGGGLVGIDLDWKGWPGEGIPLEAQELLRRFGSYAELSPSGRGLHILLWAHLEGDRAARFTLGPMGVEVYAYKEVGGRFFTYTGLLLPGFPPEPQERTAELLDFLKEALPRREEVKPPAPPEGTSPRRLRAILEAYADRVASAPVGTRHNTLIAYARAAGGLLPHGLDPHEAEEVLVAAAMQAGLPEREAREAVRWGLEVGSRAPLHLEDRGDFGPKEVFWASPLAQNPASSWTAKTRFWANETSQYKDPNPWKKGGDEGWR